MKLEFEKMIIKDLDNIKDNLESDFDDFWNYNILKSELENDLSYFIVCKYNEEIIGFAGFKKVLDELNQRAENIDKYIKQEISIKEAIYEAEMKSKISQKKEEYVSKLQQKREEKEQEFLRNKQEKENKFEVKKQQIKDTIISELIRGDE